MNGLTYRSRALLISVLVLAATGACTKKRQQRFEQGHGIGLEPVSKFDDKTFTLTTGDYLASPNETRSAKRSIDADNRGVNQLDLVSYETDAELLGDVPFRGKPHHQYLIRYRLGKKYLTISKVAPKRDIPYLESPYGHRTKNGLYEIPLVGYEIEGYYTTEPRKNSVGDDTNSQIEIKLPTSEGANFVRIDFNSRVVFDALEKIDVYPANLFAGEWYYTETVIDTSINEQLEGDGDLHVFEGLIENSAPTVTFRKSEVDLSAIKTVYDPKINRENAVNDLHVLTLPIERWVDYRAKPEGSEAGFTEEEVYARPWNERDFMQVRFDKAESKILSNTGRGEFTRTRLIDLEITSNYISFTLHQIDQRARVKYAFLRKEPRDYEPRQYFKSDRKLFGFLPTIQERLLTPEDHYRLEDYERYQRITRFDPNKDIVWHFSRNSPEYARAAAREAVEKWNASLKMAGYEHSMHVADGDVSLGDIRYNVINLIDTVSVDSRLGFGPSTTDPETGEIISATTNIYLNSFKHGYYDTLRLYIEREAGIIDAAQVSDEFAFLETASAAATLGYQFGDFGNKEMNTPINLPGAQSSLAAFTPEPVTSEKMSLAVPQFHHATPLACQSAIAEGIVIDNFYEALPKSCPGIPEYVDRLKAARAANAEITELHDEQQVLDNCYRKLLYRPLVATILHELGHNLGLRHNFRASTDKKNFYTTDDGDNLASSSSVMEYAARHATELQRPGTYDIAAIKFGYFNAVEQADGDDITIDPNLSIADNQTQFGFERKHYYYCTDEDMLLGTDPLCQRFDAGTSPIEVVKNHIRDFTIRFTNDRIRRNRMKVDRHSGGYAWPSGNALGNIYRDKFFEPIKRHYDEWRFKLRDRLGPENRYLEKFSAAEYEELLQSYANEEWYRTYRPVADLSFDFFTKLAFLTGRTCIVSNENGHLRSLDFSIEQQEVHAVSPDTQVRNCRDIASRTDRFSADGLTYIAETGFPLKDFHYLADTDYISGPLDVAGVEGTRLNALYVLMQRATDRSRGLTLLHQKLDFSPNFLDEPTYRKAIESKLVRRILEGVDITFSDPATGQRHSLKQQKHFQTESALLRYSLNLFLNGMQIPGRSFATDERLMPYMTKIARDPQDRSEAVARTIYKNQELVAFSRNVVAAAFMKEFNRINELRGRSEDHQDDPLLASILEMIASHQSSLVDAKGNTSYLAFLNFLRDFTLIGQQFPQFLEFFSETEDARYFNEDLAARTEALNRSIVELQQEGTQEEDLRDALEALSFASPMDVEGVKALFASAEEYFKRKRALEKQSYDMFSTDFHAQMDLLRSGFTALAN